jgi:hypothetical protein
MFGYVMLATTMAMITFLAIATTIAPIQNTYASVDHPDDNINKNALKACEQTDKPQFCPSGGPGDDDDNDEDDDQGPPP